MCLHDVLHDVEQSSYCRKLLKAVYAPRDSRLLRLKLTFGYALFRVFEIFMLRVIHRKAASLE